MNENEPGDIEPGRAGQQLAEAGRDLIRVLHVEDDPNCREAIADQLSDHGFVVRSFADAFSLADGLAVSSEADIILLDWDLPEISGIELLIELRQVGVNLPVVFLTGYGFKAQENLAFETGAVDFIDKARGIEILARRLRRLLKAPNPDFRCAPELLIKLPDVLRSSQDVFQRTGGLHAAALFDSTGALQVLREDIGRHNAVDKVIGWALLGGQLPLANSVLLVSGRGGFEIVQKAAAAGVPILAVRGSDGRLRMA